MVKYLIDLFLIIHKNEVRIADHTKVLATAITLLARFFQTLGYL